MGNVGGLVGPLHRAVALSAAALPAAADLPRVWRVQGCRERCGKARNAVGSESNGPWEGSGTEAASGPTNAGRSVSEAATHPERRGIEVVVGSDHVGDEEGTWGGKGGTH